MISRGSPLAHTYMRCQSVATYLDSPVICDLSVRVLFVTVANSTFTCERYLPQNAYLNWVLPLDLNLSHNIYRSCTPSTEPPVMRQPDTIEGFVRCVAADRDCTIGGVNRYAHGVVVHAATYLVDPQTISTLVVHGDKSISVPIPPAVLSVTVPLPPRTP